MQAIHRNCHSIYLEILLIDASQCNITYYEAIQVYYRIQKRGSKKSVAITVNTIRATFIAYTINHVGTWLEM